MVLKREIGSGKVIDYDGSFGSIKDNNQNEYLFSKKTTFTLFYQYLSHEYLFFYF